jgi:hypothetical protein
MISPTCHITIQSSHSSSFLPVRNDSIGHQLFLFCQPVWPPLPQYLIHIVHLHTPTQLLLHNLLQLYISCGWGFYFIILGVPSHGTWALLHELLLKLNTFSQCSTNYQYITTNLFIKKKVLSLIHETITSPNNESYTIYVESWNNKQLHLTPTNVNWQKIQLNLNALWKCVMENLVYSTNIIFIKETIMEITWCSRWTGICISCCYYHIMGEHTYKSAYRTENNERGGYDPPWWKHYWMEMKTCFSFCEIS